MLELLTRCGKLSAAKVALMPEIQRPFGWFAFSTACIVLAGVAGCSGHSAYNRVFKKPEQHNSRTYPVSLDTCWRAVNRAALSLNFGIEKEEKDKGLMEATRHFQEGKRTTTITLKASLQPETEKSTTIYANAVEKRERVYVRTHQRISFFIIPIPWGDRGKEASRVTEGEKTVTDKKFYEAFFEAVGKELYELERARTEGS